MPITKGTESEWGMKRQNKQLSHAWIENGRKEKANKSELRRCGKVEVAVLGFPSLPVFMVSVDVK